MAGAPRAETDDLALPARLAKAPYAFGFFQALRRIECANPKMARIGTSRRLRDDPVRLAQEPSLAFAPSTVRAFEAPNAKRPARLLVAFFGLLGPNGPLPLHLSEFVRDRVKNAGDPTLMRFLDVFHHRLLSLFYRAWARAQPTVSLDRPAEDRFGQYLGSLGGFGMATLRDRDSVPDYAKLSFAGLFARQVRNAESLEAMLASFFRVPVRIEQCVGHWMPIPREIQTRLGRGVSTAQLGVTAVAGERTWDVQGKFRVVVGPLSFNDYARFLPRAQSQRVLREWVRNYVGYEYTFEVKVALDRDEVPRLRLGTGGNLGWTTWLGVRTDRAHARDLAIAA